MSTTSVAKFAAELKLPTDVLLEQLKSAGVAKTMAEDLLTDDDKEHLLSALRKAHGSSAEAPKRKITLTRKSTSEIKQADGTGKARTIQVEVRKKRVFVKKDSELPEPEVIEAPEPILDVEQQRIRDEEGKAASSRRRSIARARSCCASRQDGRRSSPRASTRGLLGDGY
jgi:translation initiation factor IF-2